MEVESELKARDSSKEVEVMRLELGRGEKWVCLVAKIVRYMLTRKILEGIGFRSSETRCVHTVSVNLKATGLLLL